MSKLVPQWIVENICADCGRKVKAHGDQVSTTLLEFGRYLCDDCAAEKMEGAMETANPLTTTMVSSDGGAMDPRRFPVHPMMPCYFDVPEPRQTWIWWKLVLLLTVFIATVVALSRCVA